MNFTLARGKALGQSAISLGGFLESLFSGVRLVEGAAGLDKLRQRVASTTFSSLNLRIPLICGHSKKLNR